MTKQLIYGEEGALIDYDVDDREMRTEFMKKAVGASLTIGLTVFVDLKVLNLTKWGLALGPLRKFAFINALNLPIYWYFYTNVRQAHQNLKLHLVRKYLVSGGELLYKRKTQ